MSSLIPIKSTPYNRLYRYCNIEGKFAALIFTDNLDKVRFNAQSNVNSIFGKTILFKSFSHKFSSK